MWVSAGLFVAFLFVCVHVVIDSAHVPTLNTAGLLNLIAIMQAVVFTLKLSIVITTNKLVSYSDHYSL